jgi:tetratricopeptide (TPR) repeat protein
MKLNLRLLASAALLIFGLIWSAAPPNPLSVSAQTSKINLLDEREEAYRANNFGAAQLEQFNYKAAVDSFRRALALDSKVKIAQINLAIALFNAQEIEAALNAAQTATENAPDSPQPAYILGLIAKNQNRADDAIAAFKRVLEIDPADVGANVNLGQNLRAAEKIR